MKNYHFSLFLRSMYYVYFNEGTLHFKDNWLSLHVDDERKEIKYPCQYFIQNNSTYLESVILRLWDILFCTTILSNIDISNHCHSCLLFFLLSECNSVNVRLDLRKPSIFSCIFYWIKLCVTCDAF